MFSFSWIKKRILVSFPIAVVLNIIPNFHQNQSNVVFHCQAYIYTSSINNKTLTKNIDTHYPTSEYFRLWNYLIPDRRTRINFKSIICCYINFCWGRGLIEYITTRYFLVTLKILCHMEIHTKINSFVRCCSHENEIEWFESTINPLTQNTPKKRSEF